jgi:competence protein ComEC
VALIALRAQIPVNVQGALSGLSLLGESARQKIIAVAVGVSGNASGLALGITDGDTSGLSKSLATQLNDLSLSHLTAVSGTNCTILIAVVGAIISRLGLRRGWRITIALMVLVAYLLLVGNQASVLRAAMMAIVVLVARNLGSRKSPVDVLVFAVALMFVIDPAFASSLGFALSVFATGGVIVLSPMLEIRLSGLLPLWLRVPVAIAMSAQLACLPLLAAIQSSYNLGGLLANLIAEPVVEIITVMGLAGATMALIPGLGMVAGIVFWAASIPCQFILLVADWCATNVASVSLPVGALGVVFAWLLLMAAFWFSGATPRFSWLPALLLFGMVLTLVGPLLARLPNGSFPVKSWFMVQCDVGQGDATILRSGNHYSVIDVGRDPGPISRCLKMLNIRTIDLLVLTHFDMDHVGGLSGALAGRRVRRAFLTQFVDPRPGAEMTERLLRDQRIPVHKAALGDTGTLGAFHFLVLSPHPAGQDAVSANDGSVSMFWSNGHVGVFTMADLPATGQQRLMQEKQMWWRESYRSIPIVLKLSHHGSADQDPDFLNWVHPLITTISVGLANPYGHPTAIALDWLKQFSRVTLRTDHLGSISIGPGKANDLTWAVTGAG